MTDQGRAAERTKVRHWLYPVPPDERLFVTRSGGRIRGDYTSYRRGVVRGDITGGAGPLISGFLTMAPGDVLWLALEGGIAGCARVDRVTGRPMPSVEFTLQKRATRTLAVDPVPEALLRRALPRLGHTPIELEDPVVIEGLEWWRDHMAERDAHLLAPLGVTPLRTALGRDAARLDSPHVAAVGRLLRAHRFALGFPPQRGSVVDLVGRDETHLIVVADVAAGRGRDVGLAPGAFGHAAWLAWSMLERERSLEATVWIAFSAAPTDDLVDFLETEGCSVSWLEQGQLQLADKTARRWPAPSQLRGAWAHGLQSVADGDSLRVQRGA